MSVEGVSDVLSWYVIRTGPKQEERAIRNLNAWSVEAFAPKVKLPRLNTFTGITSYVPGPMFPRYGFARFDAGRLLRRVCYTRGVQNVVSFGGVAARLDDSIIELMRSRIGADGFVQIGSEFKAGERVRVKGGPLANFVGVFDHKIDSNDRVEILLTAVSYQGRIVVEKELVEKIDCNHALLGYEATQ
jgi:transcriptional antiterminator RfaH